MNTPSHPLIATKSENIRYYMSSHPIFKEDTGRGAELINGKVYRTKVVYRDYAPREFSTTTPLEDYDDTKHKVIREQNRTDPPSERLPWEHGTSTTISDY
jgi:hypothetical protein